MYVHNEQLEIKKREEEYRTEHYEIDLLVILNLLFSCFIHHSYIHNVLLLSTCSSR